MMHSSSVLKPALCGRPASSSMRFCAVVAACSPGILIAPDFPGIVKSIRRERAQLVTGFDLHQPAFVTKTFATWISANAVGAAQGHLFCRAEVFGSELGLRSDVEARCTAKKLYALIFGIELAEGARRTQAAKTLVERLVGRVECEASEGTAERVAV